MKPIDDKTNWESRDLEFTEGRKGAKRRGDVRTPKAPNLRSEVRRKTGR